MTEDNIRDNVQAELRRAEEALAAADLLVAHGLAADAARSGSIPMARSVSPHTLRHTKAMHLLQAGNPAIIIRDVLGHADIKTTGVYARADLEAKRRALEKAEGLVAPASPPSWHSDAGLLEWLASL